MAGFLSKDELIAPPGSFNNDIGVPATILRCSEQTKCLILEFGARNVGDISTLTQLTAPDIGVCLNAGNSHIGVFGSYANILQEKTEILINGTKLGLCLADQDDLSELASSKCKNLKFFGKVSPGDKSPDFGFEVISSPLEETKKTHLRLHAEESGASELSTNVIGPGTAAAVCVAVAVSELLFPRNQKPVLEALEEANAESGRFEQLDVGATSFINDAYNSNPQSLGAGLEVLDQHYANQAKVLVLGTMLELGSESQPMHSALAQSVSATKNLKLLVTVGEYADAFGSLCSGVHQHFKDLEAFQQSSTWNSWVQSGTIEGCELVYLKASNTVGIHKIPELLKAAQ